MAGRYVGYEQIGSEIYRFKTADGKALTLTGETAGRLKEQVDAEMPQRIGFDDEGRSYVAGTGTAHAAPEKRRGPTFDELDSLEGQPLPRQSTPQAAFARSAAAGALDTAALPVTLAARGLRAAGVENQTVSDIADLSADEAIQDATWLASGEEAGEYRRRVAQERAEFPTASAAGTELGATLGGFGVGGLAERGIARGVASVKDAADFLRKHPNGAAIEALTHGSEGDNRYLRKKASGGVSPRGQNPYTEQRAAEATAALEDAIAAGHDYRGPVTRGLDLPEETLQEWLDKGAVHNASFWSTSSDPKYLDDYFGKPQRGQAQVVLRIEEGGGVPISGVSQHPSESEVLIPPGRNWAISGVSKDEAGRTVLDLKQVDSAPGAAISFDGAASALGIKPTAAVRGEAHRKQEEYAR